MLSLILATHPYVDFYKNVLTFSPTHFVGTPQIRPSCRLVVQTCNKIDIKS